MIRADFTKQVKYEFMYGVDAVEAIRKLPVGYLPIGCLERHGDHLPMGHDAQRAYRASELIAQTVGGVVFPPHYYGGIHAMTEEELDKYTGQWGNIYTDATCQAHLIDCCEQIRRTGIKLLFLYTGHFPEAQKYMCDAIIKHFEGTDMKVVLISEFDHIEDCDHAGRFETSMFLYLARDMVNMKRIAPRNYEDHGWPGIHDPLNSSAALAEEWMERLVNFAEKIMRENGFEPETV